MGDKKTMDLPYSSAPKFTLPSTAAPSGKIETNINSKLNSNDENKILNYSVFYLFLWSMIHMTSPLLPLLYTKISLSVPHVTLLAYIIYELPQ